MKIAAVCAFQAIPAASHFPSGFLFPVFFLSAALSNLQWLTSSVPCLAACFEIEACSYMGIFGVLLLPVDDPPPPSLPPSLPFPFPVPFPPLLILSQSFAV